MSVKRTNSSWTSPEITRLRHIWPVKSQTEIMALFPRHGWGSISFKAYELGLKKAFPRGRNKWRDIAARHVPTFQFSTAQETM